MTYLLALRNAGLPQNLPILLEYAKQGGVVGLVALEAIKETGEEHFNNKVFASFSFIRTLKILKYSKYLQ